MKTHENEFGWQFENTYAQLPESFYARIKPTPVAAPKMVRFNRDLAESLGLNSKALDSDAGASFFAGNVIPPGGEPIAQAYAGHQFGDLAMLGDGRANLLGEHISPKGERWDLQLKGSGPTPFSRRGDGRAALGPMLREYIISEAMHALGIPTTRSLAVVATGEPVYRETPQPGAVLVRVASSHIRVGTFVYAASQDEPENLRLFADYTIRRHYPDLASQSEPYLGLLKAVIERQASLVSKWMLVGFVHGVMNTDNMALSGETIDYGPCAFIDRYSLSTVFSSIDSQGRYAYGNQPRIAQWNLTRFAETLLPLLDSNEDRAVAKAEEAIVSFGPLFETTWLAGMRAKLGLTSESAEATELIEALMRWMQEKQADYTNTFRALSSGSVPNGEIFQGEEFALWYKRWQSLSPSVTLMRATNPVVIPRNHRVEEALKATVDNGDNSVMDRLLDVIKRPYDEALEGSEFQSPPPSGEKPYRTFCGT